MSNPRDGLLDTFQPMFVCILQFYTCSYYFKSKQNHGEFVIFTKKFSYYPFIYTPAILLSCYPSIMLSCYSDILIFCYPAILLSCYPPIMLSCYPAILLSCYPAILLSCYSDFLISFYHAILLF